MPGVVVFGRRWNIATDDFLLVGLLDFITFLPWVVWTVYVYVEQRDTVMYCNESVLMHLYLAGLAVLFFLNCILAVSFIFFSIKGTLAQPEPRRHVVTIMYPKFVVCIVDVIWASIGTFIFHHGYFCKNAYLEFFIKVSTITIWVITLVRMIGVGFVYDNAGRIRSTASSASPSRQADRGKDPKTFAHPSVIRRWMFRVQVLFFWCTCPSKAKRDAIDTFSKLAADLFHDLDLVASDVVAGLLAFRLKCLSLNKEFEEALASAPAIISSDGSPLQCFPPPEFPAWMNLQLANLYNERGMGVFGWPWTMYRNLSGGLCLLWKKIKCCFWCRRQSHVVGDNCCACNLAGLQVSSNIPYEDVVYASFRNSIYKIPFFVAWHHETSTVLVSLRGSMSLSDMVTDLAAGLVPLDDPGIPSGIICHSGMLFAARAIKEKLENGVLEEAFKEKEHYTLVTTGHSLGATVASILALLMRPLYPSVRCYAFSPAPNLNKTGALVSEECVFTVLYGNDIVAYLSYGNIKGMMKEVNSCLKECNIHKYKLILGCNQNPYKEKTPLSDCPEKTTEGNEEKSEEDRSSSDELNEKEALPSPALLTKMYIPGKILHIRCSENGYRLRISKAEDYSPIRIRPKMILHHFPQFLGGCLAQLGQNPKLHTVTC